MGDPFILYEVGLDRFQRKLGGQPNLLLEFLNYDHQLRTNIRQARDDGDTPSLSAERNRIVRQLNILALETVKTSFNEICGLRRRKPALTAPIVKLPLPVMLFFNLVVVIVLGFVLNRPVSSLWPCVPVIASAPSLAISLLTLVHLAWRYLKPAFMVSGGTITWQWFALPLKVLASLADALHPWILSNSVLWMLAIVLFLAAGILCLSPLPLFPPPPEEMPVVQSFSVQYLRIDGTTKSFPPGDVVEIMVGEQVLVKAGILGEAKAQCTWSTASGNLPSAGRCSVWYGAPFNRADDVLSVTAESPCKTQSACASLSFRVISHDQ